MTWDNWSFGDAVKSETDKVSKAIGTGGAVIKCTTSKQCAKGFGCVGGKCVKLSGAGGGTGGYSSAQPSGGGCGSGPDGGSNCGPSSGSGCRTGTCGDGAAIDCCGDKCCRFDAAGNLQCWCGPCPVFGIQSCVQYCDEYYKTHGSLSPACSDGSACDECEECSATNPDGSSRCQQKTAGPCQCDRSGLSECDICQSDGTVVQGECLVCCEQTLDCCGSRVVSNGCHQANGYTGPSACNLAQQANEAKCAELCKQTQGDPNPCRGVCESTTIIQNGSNCGGDAPAGPGDKNRIVTGCIEAGGKTAWLVDDCDMSNVPDYCSNCGCNCHNDCAENCLCVGGNCLCEIGRPKKYTLVANGRKAQTVSGGNCTLVGFTETREVTVAVGNVLKYNAGGPNLTGGCGNLQEPGLGGWWAQDVGTYKIQDKDGVEVPGGNFFPQTGLSSALKDYTVTITIQYLD